MNEKLVKIGYPMMCPEANRKLPMFVLNVDIGRELAASMQLI